MLAIPRRYLSVNDISVQLLFFDGCPLADAARANLEQALADCGMRGYEEIDILDPSTPDDLPGWGSPTILVNGIDISGQPKGDSVSCRVYLGPDRVPNPASIATSIKSAQALGPTE